MRHCKRCNLPRPSGGRFCGNCGVPFEPTPLHTDVSRRDSAGFAPATELLASSWSSLQISWDIAGSFNVESGEACVSNQYFDSCECHLKPRGPEPCFDCGRSNQNSETCASGQGDGVFPVFTLRDGQGRTTGAVAYFIEHWAVPVEKKTKFPCEIVYEATAIRLGSINSNGRLFFNEAHTGWNSRNVTVDVNIPAGEYSVIAWLAEVPILRENGMKPYVRPISLSVYSSELMAALEQQVHVDRSPDAFEAFRYWNMMMWPVMSHKVPAWPRAIRYNYNDDQARGNHLRAISWCLQGALYSDEFSIQTLENARRALPLDEAIQIDLLIQRGQRARPKGNPVNHHLHP